MGVETTIRLAPPHREMRKRCLPVSAFTLIELLVVIAIIGVLAALLFPALSRARESTRQTVCRSNVRQIGMALQFYADENRGRFPDASTNNPAFYGNWWPWDLNTNLVAELESKGVTRNILYCPSRPDMNDDQHWNFWKYFPSTQIRVAGYVFLLHGGIQTPTNLWRSRLSSRPSETELVLDATVSQNGDFGTVWGMLRERTSHLERGQPAGGNLAFEDGHVEWRNFQKMKHQIYSDVGVVWDF